MSVQTKIICKEATNKDPKSSTEKSISEDEIISCALCNSFITRPSNKIIVDQTFSHVFANPHGIVFEIGCFDSAPGCIAGSASSTEFSWFPGYSWKIGACQFCSSHLGWIFSSKEDRFFGLILDKLIFP